MRIFTSSFHSTLPDTYERISIARWAPNKLRHLPTLRSLCPGPWFNSVETEVYRKLYLSQLAKLDPQQVVLQIEAMTEGRPAALLCWERPTDGNFCHRGFVSAWLQEQLGIEVFEYGLTAQGCGASHPKLPVEYRIGIQKRLI